MKVLAGRRVADTDDAQFTGRGEPLPVRADGDTTVVALEGTAFLAGGGVPDLDCLVLAARGQPPAVRAEGHTIDTGDVPLQGKELLAGPGIPHLYGLIQVSRGKSFAIGAKADGMTVAAQCESDLAGVGVPNLDGMS